ncbi:MAG: carboxypeptidase regulatory-like domain-containing protein [Nitrospinae bacterium]|nr:carboxypeptidase regulatory-like domain-containing protein [Nitrospinota bacterium]
MNTIRLCVGAACALTLLYTAPAGAATVKGVISTPKKAGAPEAIKVTKDHAICGAKPLTKEEMLVSGAGGLKNAVVIIEGAGKAAPGKGGIAQQGGRFEPHVITLPAKSKLEIKNNDGISHNFHSFGFENDPVNFSQPGEMKVKVVDKGFDYPEVIKIQCDIHEWMNAWIVVSDESAVAVTGADGSFSIANIKPGNYTVKVWHEKLGEVTQKVTVKDGDNQVNVALGK